MSLLLLPLCAVPPSASQRPASTRGGASCSSDSDCNLNGVCVTGACVCDRGWSGPSCGQLDLLPVEARSPAATSGQIWPPQGLQQSAWGGNVVAGADGGFELVVSDLGTCGLEAWQTNSRIVSAKSKSLTGPFVFDSEVMGAFAHNANPVKISAGPDRGALAVFHVGDGITKGSLRRCSNGTTPPMISSPAMSARHAFAEGPAAQNSTKACKPQKHAPISLSKSISTPYRNGSSGAWGSVRQSCNFVEPRYRRRSETGPAVVRLSSFQQRCAADSRQCDHSYLARGVPWKPRERLEPRSSSTLDRALQTTSWYRQCRPQ